MEKPKENEDMLEEIAKAYSEIETLKNNLIEHRRVLSAAASMAGQNWLYVQLAISEFLTNVENKPNLEWMMQTYKEMEK